MRIYRSKVDVWLSVVLIGPCLLLLTMFLVPLLRGGSTLPSLIIPMGLFVLFSAFIIWLYLATKYKVSDTELIVDGGLFRVTIPFHSIQSIIKSRSIVASPAFSLDRLKITYDKNKTVLISPKKRDEFLSDIGWDNKLL